MPYRNPLVFFFAERRRFAKRTLKRSVSVSVRNASRSKHTIQQRKEMAGQARHDVIGRAAMTQTKVWECKWTHLPLKGRRCDANKKKAPIGRLPKFITYVRITSSRSCSSHRGGVPNRWSRARRQWVRDGPATRRRPPHRQSRCSSRSRPQPSRKECP